MHCKLSFAEVDMIKRNIHPFLLKDAFWDKPKNLQDQYGDVSQFGEEKGLKHEEFNWLTPRLFLGLLHKIYGIFPDLGIRF